MKNTFKLLFLISSILNVVLLSTSIVVQATESERDDHLSLLTLNLHTYQEFSTPGKKEAQLNEQDALQRVRDHGPLFDKIANAIIKLNIDVVCLQEVGEWKNHSDNSFGKHKSNAALQIIQRLRGEDYYVYMDWSHYGWDVWKEGSAIISRLPILSAESKYISKKNNGTKNFWQSRNVIKAQLKLNDSVNLNVFSVHAGWWDSEIEPFQEQYEHLQRWVKTSTKLDEVTILCGDFNQPAAEKGYQLMTGSGGYVDLYLKANPTGMYDKTVEGNIAGWERDEKGTRIDYFLMNSTSSLKVVQSQRIFTEKLFGRVSDHLGIYVQLNLDINQD